METEIVMSTTEAVQAVQIAIGVLSVLAALVGIAGALVAVFWRGAKFAEASAAAVIESERRLVDKIGDSEQRLVDRVTEFAEASAAAAIESERRLVDKIGDSEQRLVDKIAASVSKSEQRLVDKIAASVSESEQRLVDRITASEQRLRGENERAHAAIGTNLDRLSDDVRQLSGALGSLANDVAFLSGRRHEGDLHGKDGHEPVTPA